MDGEVVDEALIEKVKQRLVEAVGFNFRDLSLPRHHSTTHHNDLELQHEQGVASSHFASDGLYAQGYDV